MKKRYAWMLALLVMLFAALPGRAFAAAIPFTAGSAVKGLNKNGKAVCGTEISFDPEALFNEQMMELFSEGNDYEFGIDSYVLEIFYPETDPDGIYRLNIPVHENMPGGSFKIVIKFNTSSGIIRFESEKIDIVGDISKYGDVLDCDKERIYNGTPRTQPLLVFFNSVGIEEGKDYTVSYTNNINAGTATVTINGKGGYIGSITKTFQIKKAANLMSVRKKTVKVKASKLKKKKQVIKCSKSMGICTAVGKLEFKLEKVNKKKFKKYFKVNSQNGNITIKRGLKKGTYKLLVRVSAAGNVNYLAASRTVTITIKVK